MLSLWEVFSSLFTDLYSSLNVHSDAFPFLAFLSRSYAPVIAKQSA